MGSVEIEAVVANRDGIISVTLLLDGATRLSGLTAEAMRALASQHPHHADKPIRSLRYVMRRRP
jgi:hypothetical protein